MEAICPQCNRSIDLTRAPVARIVGLKVVSFCSTECADAAVRGEPPRVDDSGPVTSAEPAPRAEVVPAGEPRTAAPAGEPRASAPAEEPREIGLAADGAPQRAEPASAGAEGDLARDRSPRSRPPLKVAAMSLKKRVVAAASSAVLLLGLVIVAVEACPSQSSVRAAAVTEPAESQRAPERVRPTPVPDPVVEAPASADEINPRLLYDHAVDSLRQLLTSRSLRLQRVAAMALSRTGDADAIDRLRALTRDTDSALVRVEIAYGLARAGDERGRRVLVESLSNRDRDARLDAASALVRLGDTAGAKVLRNLLSYKRFRIGAARLLARLGDEKGLAVLRSARIDDKVSNELKMRATVALGFAGDASVRDDLAAILAEGKFQVGAAQALAALGDRAAVPALTKYLKLDSFRVSAALSLRRLGAEVDLEPLAVALQTGSDVARVTSAEAILILTGPANLAEID